MVVSITAVFKNSTTCTVFSEITFIINRRRSGYILKFAVIWCGRPDLLSTLVNRHDGCIVVAQGGK